MRYLLLLLLALPARAQDLSLVRCSRDVFAAAGERVWPGWSDAPFSLLLIDGETEYLVSPPAGTTGFTPSSNDAHILTRKRITNPNLLATYPAVGDEPTIVVGTPKMTGKSDAAWVITLLHEHFHQLQYSWPGYYAASNKLGLARGDETGMWMLNYPFPYADANVQQRMTRFTSALANALAARGSASFAPALREVKLRWRELRESLDADDYAYLMFQVYQEGVARYVELRVAEELAKRGTPCLSREAAKEVAAQLRADIDSGLANPRLAERQRVAFYAIGAAVALLLDEVSPYWKRDYIARPFAIESYFAP
ncbi:MAG: hypothetical protein JWO97_4756 [Acidobacteria bacterium]|nr:hypothetical protein [Acidobacteriota bacterium]